MDKKKQLIQRTLTIPCTGIHVRESAEGGESRTIAGYAILFNTESSPLWNDEENEGREVIDPAAITKDLLDQSDIKFTMYHNREILLARSLNGEGTLKYFIDEKGVGFEFESPRTMYGDEAIELVKRGDLKGCSFMFATYYYDESFVERTVNVVNGRTIIIYRVKVITGIYDMTLAADPAYPDTSVEARELVTNLRKPAEPEKKEDPKEKEELQKQLREMRNAATQRLYV